MGCGASSGSSTAVAAQPSAAPAAAPAPIVIAVEDNYRKQQFEDCCNSCVQAAESDDIDLMMAAVQEAHQFIDEDDDGRIDANEFAKADERIQQVTFKLTGKLVAMVKSAIDSNNERTLENVLGKLQSAKSLMVIVQTIYLEYRAAALLVRMKLESALGDAGKYRKEGLVAAVLAARQWEDYIHDQAVMYHNIDMLAHCEQMLGSEMPESNRKELQMAVDQLRMYNSGVGFKLEAELQASAQQEINSLKEQERLDALQGEIDDALRLQDLSLLKAAFGASEKAGLDTNRVVDAMVQIFDRKIKDDSTDNILDALRELDQKYKRCFSSEKVSELMSNGIQQYRLKKHLPDTWNLDLHTLDAVHKPEYTNGPLFDAMQQLLDQTFVKKWTQDRKIQTRERDGPSTKGHPVPNRLILKKVQMVQNEDVYVGYMAMRRKIISQIDNDGGPKGLRQDSSVDDGSLTHLSDLSSDNCISTFKAQPNWSSVLGGAEPIAPEYNEFYLFHGTKPKYVEMITESDFLIQMAGSSAGTLYGRGVYCGESSTKGDEYAFRNKGDHATTKSEPNGLRCMLVCRALLGRIRYNCEAQPADIHGLVASVTNGRYHSVLGDRKKIRGTFREFVVFNKDQLYPEFVLWFSRDPEPLY